MVNQCKSSIGHVLPIITPGYQDNEIPKYISQYVPIIKPIIHLISSYILFYPNKHFKLHKVVPPSYTWVIIPLTIDISPINHSYWTYKPTCRLKIHFFGPKELWKESTGELLCRSHPMLGGKAKPSWSGAWLWLVYREKWRWMAT